MRQQKLPRYVGCLGNIGAGKDMVCDYLANQHHYTKRGFSDRLYAIMAILNPMIPIGESLTNPIFRGYNALVAEYGIDYVKRNFPEVRRLLRVLGTECGREVHGPKCWVHVMDRDSRGDWFTAIRDVRFPDEVDWLRSQDSLLIHVTSTREQKPSSHISDFAVNAAEEADYTIVNNGTLADLYREVDSVLDQWAASISP